MSIVRARKKPVGVNVFHYQNRSQFLAIRDWIDKDLIIYGNDSIQIPTLEGITVASLNDWIIKGVKGEFYACKPDIFDATYVLETEEPQQIIIEPLIKFEGAERNYNAYYINDDEYLGRIEDKSDLVSKVSFFPAIEIREFSIEEIIEISSFMKLLKDNPLKEIKVPQ